MHWILDKSTVNPPRFHYFVRLEAVPRFQLKSCFPFPIFQVRPSWAQWAPLPEHQVAWHHRVTVRPNQKPRLVKSLRCLRKGQAKTIETMDLTMPWMVKVCQGSKLIPVVRSANYPAKHSQGSGKQSHEAQPRPCDSVMGTPWPGSKSESTVKIFQGQGQVEVAPWGCWE